jgi:hypothetical protein
MENNKNPITKDGTNFLAFPSGFRSIRLTRITFLFLEKGKPRLCVHIFDNGRFIT